MVTVEDLEKLTGQPTESESQATSTIDALVNRLSAVEAQVAALSGQPVTVAPAIDYNAVDQRLQVVEQLVQSMSTTIHDTHNFIQAQILPQLSNVEQQVNPMTGIVKGPPAK